MSELETDIVLSAIRRGEDSFPKLRAATGLEYAQLHIVLHKLEFEWKSINSTETASGFLRFTPVSSEKSNGTSKKVGKEEKRPAPATPPQALKQTEASISARDVALFQRDAPYCIKCRSLCLFDGLDSENRPHWRCNSCKSTFEGSSKQVDEVARIDPHKEAEAKISAMIERGRAPVQPAQAEALPERLQESRQNITKVITNNGSNVSSARPGKFGISIHLAIRQIVEAMPVGTETDTPRLHTLLVAAHPHLRNHDEQARLRTYISQAVSPLKGHLLELVCRGTSSNPDLLRRIESGTNSATETSQPEHAQIVSPDISEDKIEVAKERDIIPEKYQSQDTQMVTRTPDLAEGCEVQGKFQIKYEGLTVYCDYPEEVIELAERLQSRFIEPRHPTPSTIKRAWSLEFEDNSEEGMPALTMMYLVSMLHDGMEDHEKDAVFTLLLYLKRVQAAAEAARQAKAEKC